MSVWACNEERREPRLVELCENQLIQLDSTFSTLYFHTHSSQVGFSCLWDFAYILVLSPLVRLYRHASQPTKESLFQNPHRIIVKDDQVQVCGASGVSVSLEDVTSTLNGLTDWIDIQCGFQHIVLLDSHGHVYGFGFNKYGQVGQSPAKQVPLGPIHIPHSIHKLALGQHHTVALSHCGEYVYTLGRNNHGQLGVDPSRVPMSSEPICLSSRALFDEKVIDIVAGWSHTGVLTASGRVWMWGRNDKGQLGINHRSSSFIPVLVAFDRPIYSIHSKTEHSIAIDDQHIAYAWGWNEHNNCGLGHQEDILLPTRIPLLPLVKRGYCSHGVSFFIE